MKNWINDRKKEVTTWSVGIPSIILGVMTLLDADHGRTVSKIVAGQADNFASGDWTTGLMALGLGIVGIFARER